MQNDTVHETFSDHDSDSTHESDALRDAALAALNIEKIDDVTVIDLRGRSSLADFMVIGTGSSSRRVAAAAQKVMSALKPLCKRTPTCEGLAVGDWVLVDAGEVVIHLFRPEIRTHYALEKIWGTLKTPGTTLAREPQEFGHDADVVC